jgi:hypothetical protein
MATLALSVIRVDGYVSTVDFFMSASCGGYNSTATPVVYTDDHIDTVGLPLPRTSSLISWLVALADGHNGTVSSVSYQWLRKHCQFLLL